jgi:MoxR-like ATPase
MRRMEPSSPADVERALAEASYLADRGLSTAIYLALAMRRPLLLEGEAGVGKTEVAKTLARLLGAELIRLQCYEGIDAAQALYEWDYSRQLLYARAVQAGETERLSELYGPEFLLERPLLRAIRAGPAAVLLIDELDRADDEFEAFLLEVLSDFTVSVPELGTIRAEKPPMVVITSNRTRELHDALKRRCLYHWIDFPDLEREVEIVRLRVPGVE